MGEYIDSFNIRCYEPDNDSETLYIKASWEEIELHELHEKIETHFGTEVNKGKFTMRVTYIQVRCLGYPHYDHGDYESYIVIYKNK